MFQRWIKIYHLDDGLLSCFMFLFHGSCTCSSQALVGILETNLPHGRLEKITGYPSPFKMNSPQTATTKRRSVPMSLCCFMVSFSRLAGSSFIWDQVEILPKHLHCVDWYGHMPGLGRLFQGSVPQTQTLDWMGSTGFPRTSLSSLFSCAVRWDRDLARNWQWGRGCRNEAKTHNLNGLTRGSSTVFLGSNPRDATCARIQSINRNHHTHKWINMDNKSIKWIQTRNVRPN